MHRGKFMPLVMDIENTKSDSNNYTLGKDEVSQPFIISRTEIKLLNSGTRRFQKLPPILEEDAEEYEEKDLRMSSENKLQGDAKAIIDFSKAYKASYGKKLTGEASQVSNSDLVKILKDLTTYCKVKRKSERKSQEKNGLRPKTTQTFQEHIQMLRK